MLSWLNSVDRSIFLYLNGLHTSWLDGFMWYCSGTILWLPLYALIIYLFISKLKKESWMLIFALALLLFLSDYISSGIIKHAVMRLRPSHDESLAGLVHLYQHANGDFYKGGLYGFVSSHAANTFAVATFSSLLLKNRWFTIGIFAWAVLVSYSRIYLGVHYLGDILGGICVGTASAWFVYKLFSYWYCAYTKKDML